MAATDDSTRRREVMTRVRRPKPPLAPASAFLPNGRRRLVHYTYSCRTCHSYHFGRAKTLDEVTGVRRAGCGHLVSVMIARIYSSPGAA